MYRTQMVKSNSLNYQCNHFYLKNETGSPLTSYTASYTAASADTSWQECNWSSKDMPPPAKNHSFNIFRVTDTSLFRDSFWESLRSQWQAVVWRLVKSHCSHPSMLCQPICFSSKHPFTFLWEICLSRWKSSIIFQETCHSSRHHSVVLHVAAQRTLYIYVRCGSRRCIS